MIKLILKLLQKIRVVRNKRRIKKLFQRGLTPLPRGCVIKFQYTDDLKETGNFQKNTYIKLKDGTKIALTDKKKEKGSLSWTW